MNLKQKVCIWIGIASFVLMGLLPPWVYRFDSDVVRMEASAGYSFLTSPPAPKEGYYAEQGDFITVRIDVTRLLIQWAMVVVLVGGLFVTLRERRIS